MSGKKTEEISIDIPSNQSKSSSTAKAVANASPVTIASVVAFYFTVSISVVFLNKIIMKGNQNAAYLKFDYPLTMTWYQLVVALICIVVTYPLNKKVSFLKFLPDLEFDWDVAKNVFSLSLVYVLMLATNNLCLKYVDVSFYQVARSLSICFSIIFTFVILGDVTTMKAIIACCVVVVGYIIGSIGEFRLVHFSVWGVIYGLASSAFVALNSILVKQKLTYVRKNHWLLLIYNTSESIILLLPLVWVSGELEGVMNFPYLTDLRFWIVMTITALFGYLINIAMYLQINYTSPLTKEIAGTAKACVQTLLAVPFFGDSITGLKLFGTLLCIGGSAWYSKIQYDVGQERKKASEAAISQ